MLLKTPLRKTRSAAAARVAAVNADTAVAPRNLIYARRQRRVEYGWTRRGAVKSAGEAGLTGRIWGDEPGLTGRIWGDEPGLTSTFYSRIDGLSIFEWQFEILFDGRDF